MSTYKNRKRGAMAALLLVLSACGGTGSEPTTTSITTIVTSTTTIAPTTTTTLGPQEVLDRFRLALTDTGYTGSVDVHVELHGEAGSVEGSGRLDVSGNNSYLITEYPNMDLVEAISFDGVVYNRVGDQPWISDRTPSDPFAEPADDAAGEDPAQVFRSLKGVGDLTHIGTEIKDGMEVHRIGLPDGGRFDPAVFGYPADAIIGATFWANPDGSPHSIVIDATSPGAESGLGRVVMTLIYTDRAPVPVAAPEDPWVMHRSEEMGYETAYPEVWDLTSIGAPDLNGDGFIAIDGTELSIYRIDLGEETRVSLNSWIDDFRMVPDEEGSTVSFGEAGETTVIGLPARTIEYHVTDETYGNYSAIYAVAQVDPTTVFEWFLFYIPDVGFDPHHLLDDFLSTFALVGDSGG